MHNEARLERISIWKQWVSLRFFERTNWREQPSILDVPLDVSLTIWKKCCTIICNRCIKINIINWNHLLKVDHFNESSPPVMNQLLIVNHLVEGPVYFRKIRIKWWHANRSCKIIRVAESFVIKLCEERQHCNRDGKGFSSSASLLRPCHTSLSLTDEVTDEVLDSATFPTDELSAFTVGLVFSDSRWAAFTFHNRSALWGSSDTYYALWLRFLMLLYWSVDRVKNLTKLPPWFPARNRSEESIAMPDAVFPSSMPGARNELLEPR